MPVPIRMRPMRPGSRIAAGQTPQPDKWLRDTQRAAIRLYEGLGYVRWGIHPVYARVEERIVPGHYYYKLLESPVAAP